MKNIALLILFLLAGYRQAAAQFTVRLVVDDDSDQLLVQIMNTVANVPTTSQRISSINMRLTGSGVDGITSVTTNYTMLLPNESGIITMNSTSLVSPENWIQNNYVTVATYSLDPGGYTVSSFSVQPDLDGDNSDVDDPIMSVQAAGFFNIPLVIEATSPLPVELVYFTARNEGCDALLSWATATEHNNKGFEMHRSSDGKKFESIGWVDGYGNSQTPHQYAFKDENIPFGIHYYRLKQVDYDGGVEFLGVRSVSSTNNSSALLLYPNPTEGILYFSAPADIMDITVSLFNAKGQLLGCPSIHQNRMDLTKFPAGLYFVYIEHAGRKDLAKVIKQ